MFLSVSNSDSNFLIRSPIICQHFTTVIFLDLMRISPLIKMVNETQLVPASHILFSLAEFWYATYQGYIAAPQFT